MLTILLKSSLLHIVILIYTTFSYYYYSNKKRHVKVYLAVFFFFLTVVLFSINNFEVLKINEVLIISSLVIPGLSFLFVYISDSGNKLFLYLFVLWIALGLVILYTLPNIFILNLIGEIINMFLLVLPFIFISLGIIILLKKKKELFQKSSD